MTGRDHRAVQRYIIGIIAGAIPPKFLAAIRGLLDFRYLSQMPRFDDNSLNKVEAALRMFHNNKLAIISAGGRQGSKGPLEHWEIPKLELLQNVVPSIRASGAIMQWTADVTEHAHVMDIKQPARSGNNQDYYSQIAWHLDHSNKCFRFDIATRFASAQQGELDDHYHDHNDEHEDEHEPDSEALHVSHYHTPTCRLVNYFETAKEIASGAVPNTVLPPRIFSSSRTAFHLAVKPLLRVSIDEASELYALPELRSAITDYFRHIGCSGVDLAAERMQTWFKVRVQQQSYHDQELLEQPQSLLATPPSARLPGGQYDFAIVSETDQSDWPSNGLRGTFHEVTSIAYIHHLTGHTVVQVHLIFHLLHTDTFLAYVQHFNITSPSVIQHD